MTANTKPVNLDILKLEQKDLLTLGKVDELNIFAYGNTFHPNGLFSTTIFGQVGSKERGKTFGYTDLNCEILHPVIHRAIVACKAFYKQIMEGTVTALWDNKTKEFVKSIDPAAETGYTFFMSHLHELKFERNKSEKRSANITLVEEAIKSDTAKIRYLLIMPAALRDYSISPNGVPEEDEINTLYRRIIPQSQLVDPLIAKKSPAVYDNIYVNIQKSVNALVEYIEGLIQGKHKLILGKWLSRKIFNSTRNVLIASVNTATYIDDPNRIRSNDVGCGLYQYLRVIAPVSLYEIRNNYLKNVFIEGNQFAVLTNVKTLQKEEVLNTHIQKDYDLWSTMEGLESIIDNFGNLDTRHLPVVLNKGKHYLGLIYNDGKVVKFFQDIRELPEGFKEEYVSPITLGEILYMSVGHLTGKYPGLVTRYPINGYGGIYPAWVKIATTSESISVIELNENWEKSDKVFPTFSVRNKDYLNGISVHQSHMGALGADMDGDTISLVALLTDDAIEEVKKTLSSKNYYMTGERKMFFSNKADVLTAVLAYMTN